MSPPPGITATLTDRRAAGTAVRRARRGRSLTLREAAASLGISAGTLSAIENGRDTVSLDRVRAVVDRLGASPLELSPPDRQLGWRDFPPLDLPAPLAGALAAFVELGYHGAGMREIAHRAGLSVPGVYHHWGSKQELLVALLDLTMEDLTRRCGAARAEVDGPLARLSRLVECLALYHTHRRELGFIGASEMRSLEPADRARIAAARGAVQRMVDEEVLEAQRRGVCDTPLPREAARAVVTMCTALPQWWQPDGALAPDELARQYVEFALDLIRARR